MRRIHDYLTAEPFSEEPVWSGDASAHYTVRLTVPPTPCQGLAADAAGKPLLVMVDNAGRLTRFDWLRATGLWSGLLVLGSQRTPEAHCDRLRSAGVGFHEVGDDRVNLERALGHLHTKRGIEAVRVDAGPGLNGALLDAGLLHEVSVLLAPYLVGTGRGVVGGFAAATAQALELTSVEAQPDGHVWLRYAVKHS